MSPYIVTTKRPCPEGHAEPLMQGDGCGWDGAHYHTPPCEVCDDRCEVIASSVAVGTLEEARKATRRKLEPFLPGGVLKGDPAKWLSAAWSVPESGGSVGPLPDGSLIEVEQVGWRRIEDSLGYHLGYPGGTGAALDAWNTRQAS